MVLMRKLMFSCSFFFFNCAFAFVRLPFPSLLRAYRLQSEGEDFYSEDSSEFDRAEREEQTMKMAPRVNFEEIPCVTVPGLIKELGSSGVIRINNLLNPQQVNDLLAFILNEWDYSLTQMGSLEVNVRNNYFSNSKAQTNRWDLKLRNSEVIRSTLQILLCPGSLVGGTNQFITAKALNYCINTYITDTIHGIVGDGGLITELAAFITTPGSGRQIIHRFYLNPS